MKNLTLFILVFLASVLKGQNFDVNFDKVFKSPDIILSESNTDDIITQYNNVTIVLDTLAIYTDKPNQDYFINIRIRFYSFSEDNSDLDKPAKEYGMLYKQTIRTTNNVAFLTNLRLTPTTSLEGINLVQVEVKLVKVNGGSDKINNIITNTLNKLISDAIGLSLVDDLLNVQKDPNEEELIFKQDFDIPLNSVEYSALTVENSKRLLRSKEFINIPLEGKVQGEILKGSVAGGIVNFASNLFNKVLGTPEIRSKINYTGVARLFFTNKPNTIIPPALKNDIDDIVQSMISRNYPSTKEFVDRLRNTNSAYIALPNTNNQLSFTISQFCNLADEYIAFLSQDELAEKDQKKFRNSYKRFFSAMLTHARDNKFKIYGVDGILKDKKVPIYVPYTLDESALREFVRWQIEVHELLAQVSQINK